MRDNGFLRGKRLHMNEATSQTLTPPRPLEPRQNAIIVGASSGIGAALARRLSGEGYALALLARREAHLQSLCAEINAGGVGEAIYFIHDVLATADVPALFQRVCEALGGLDVFVYNAGTQYPNDATVFSYEKDLRVFRVNLLGAAAWVNLVAERFQRAGAGHIVGIGSVAGDRGRRGMPAYTASKSGLETYLEGWRNRVARYGVTVTTIKPGQVQTALLKNADRERTPISVEAAAESIWKAISRRQATAYVPARWAIVGLVLRHMPGFIFRRLNI